MDIIFLAIGCVGLAFAGDFCWHLLTDEDECRHPDVGQHGGECRDCGDVFEIGGSE